MNKLFAILFPIAFISNCWACNYSLSNELSVVRVNSKGMCGGFLLEPDVVITAAHCVGNRLGTITCGDSRDIIKILFWSINENTDIAIGLIDEQVDGCYSESVITQGKLGDDVQFAAYGMSGPGNYSDIGHLRIGFSSISDVVKDEYYITGDTTCKGDSGGPVFVINSNELDVIGFISHAYLKNGCAETTHIKSFYYYREWIGQQILILRDEND